jgi:hypothetical protein
MVKKQKSKIAPYEKILAKSGAVLVALAAASSIYYLYANRSFVHDLFGLAYYLNYLLILGGGFAIGYLLSRGTDKSSKVYIGATYALLAMSLYSLIYVVPFLIDRFYGMLPFPWGRILFEGLPIFALLLTTLIAYIFQFRPGKGLSPQSMKSFVRIFALAQIYSISNLVYWTVMTPSAEVSDQSLQTPLYITIAGYLSNPIVIALAAFLLIGTVKNLSARIFAASFIGAFSSALLYILWNFRTDPSADSINVFQLFVFSITMIATVLLILKVRKAAKHK